MVMAVKMSDVARKANVSVATVSMILNDQQNVYKFSSDTVDNVKRIAEKLGYRRNKLALSLRHQKNHQVGVLSGGYRMDTWGQMLEGISTALQPDYALVTSVHNYNPEIEKSCLEYFLDIHVSGLIANWSGSADTIDLYKKLVYRYKIPVILIDWEIPGLDLSIFRVNDHDMVYLSTKALIELGHRNIFGAFYGRNHQYFHVNPCIYGYCDAIKALADVEPVYLWNDNITGPVHLASYGFYLEQFARQVVDYLLRNRQFTALAVDDDQAAYYIMSELKRAGLHVPEDISIIAGGNKEPSKLPLISLSSTASESFFGNGRMISEIMLEMINCKLPLCGNEYNRKLNVFLRNSVRRLN
jgi:LacI family transcriptional regulator